MENELMMSSTTATAVVVVVAAVTTEAALTINYNNDSFGEYNFFSRIDRIWMTFCLHPHSSRRIRLWFLT